MKILVTGCSGLIGSEAVESSRLEYSQSHGSAGILRHLAAENRGPCRGSAEARFHFDDWDVDVGGTLNLSLRK